MSITDTYMYMYVMKLYANFFALNGVAYMMGKFYQNKLTR